MRLRPVFVVLPALIALLSLWPRAASAQPNRASPATCKALLDWILILEREMAPTNVMTIVMDRIGVHATNLFRDEYFVPVFGKRIAETTFPEMQAFFVSMFPACGQHLTGASLGQFQRMNVLVTAPFRTQNGPYSYTDVVAGVAERETILARVRTTAGGQGQPTPQLFDEIERDLTRAPTDLQKLWPREQQKFAEMLTARRRGVARALLQSAAGRSSEYVTRGEEGARALRTIYAEHQRYLDVLEPSEREQFVRQFEANVDFASRSTRPASPTTAKTISPATPAAPPPNVRPAAPEATRQTVGDFRRLGEAEKRKALEALAGNVIAVLSAATDAKGQPKSDAQRRSDRVGVSLTRALFTNAPDANRTTEPLGIVEVRRRALAPEARLDQPLTDLLGDYLRERHANLVTTGIMDAGDPAQELALRVAVGEAEVALYDADYRDAKRREADALAREKKAHAAIDIWTTVERAGDAQQQGNHAEALALYQQAAARGNAVAMCAIALMHGQGRAVPKSESLDFEWSLKCARAGNAHGMYRVSLAYDTDPDFRRNFYPTLPKNADESFAWGLKAANLGHKVAMRNLARMYGEGRGTKADAAEANRWFQLSQTAGDAPLGAVGDPGK
jgi:Sel1 repeat-containing protein